jgi:ABC-type transporter Mla maintaining outer membrane lipid asymmetry ATPase subunit MlaF
MTPLDGFTDAPTVLLDGLYAQAGAETVLRDVTLSLDAGTVTVILGPTGSGKTMLARVIAGVAEPARGAVMVDGRDLGALSYASRRAFRSTVAAKLGGSYTYHSAFSDSMTVLENLAGDLSRRGLPAHECEPRAMQRLHEAGLADYHDRTPGMLPAQAQRRLAVIRAVAMDSWLTILDEIDAGLSEDGVRSLLHVLDQARRRRQTTMLITTHRLDVARALADRIVILLDGRVAANGTTNDVAPGYLTIEELYDQLRRRAPAARDPQPASLSWAFDAHSSTAATSRNAFTKLAATTLTVLVLILLLALFAYAYGHLS